ncbi:MAG TPA: hypothetical protein VMI54_24395 [Polyangiaceae bacterium]|nr:hypothetical protein [Polyangiaceae bacterium]
MRGRVVSGPVFGACLMLCACAGRSQGTTSDGAANRTGGTGAGASSGTGDETGGAGASSGTGGGGGTGGSGTGGGGSGGAAGTAGAPAGGTGGSATSVDCQALATELATTFEQATACDPNGPADQCSATVTTYGGCDCPAYANPANAGAEAEYETTLQAYQDGDCALGVVCGACITTVRGTCDATGHCAAVAQGNGRSCMVNGVVYADGESGIADPTSCNTCSCVDGELACTEIGGCETPCPDGEMFGQACAECGRPSGCVTVETGCFATCPKGCADPTLTCLNGLCVPEQCF